jgi:antitoxin component of MazEF toxin-antitoxin module
MPNLYTRKILEVGNSMAVSLPKPWLRYHKLEIGHTVEVITNDDVIVIRPIREVVVRKKVGEEQPK